MKLEDVNSEEDARMFVGKEVFYPLDAVDEEDLVGDMTWDSFIGYTVTDVQKGYLGEITEWMRRQSTSFCVSIIKARSC